MFKRFLSITLVLCLLCVLNLSGYNVFEGTTASASMSYSYPVNNCAFYIQHVGSGKYLDVTDVSTSNGARLQIWQRYPTHQNQVFVFKKVGAYWTITAQHSQKVIEVRNSSKDNYAHVSQWTYGGIACQQWKVVTNSDGTVSFQNRNSGKYLDVCGNVGNNGTKIIQYTRNSSNAQRFKLYGCTANDILSASWERDFSRSPIQWKQLNTRFYVNQTTYFQNKPGYTASQYSGWFPVAGVNSRQNCKILVKVEYIDSNTVWEMIRKKSLYPSFKRSITDLLKGEATEEAASHLLGKIGIKVPVIGVPIGVLQIIADSSNQTEWNKFANTAVQGKGLVVTTYATIVYRQDYNGRTYITDSIERTYAVWDGKTVKTSYGYSGNLTYAFK